jgi:hypothetical protein
LVSVDVSDVPDERHAERFAARCLFAAAVAQASACCLLVYRAGWWDHYLVAGVSPAEAQLLVDHEAGWRKACLQDDASYSQDVVEAAQRERES